MHKIVIYRNTLLPLSETFIQTQASALPHFEISFAGLKPVKDGLSLPGKVVLLTKSESVLSRVRRGVFLKTGFAPGFIKKLRQAGPGLVHAHFATDATTAVYLSRALEIPLICTLHGYDVTTRDEFFEKTTQGRLFLKRRELLWREAAKFVPTSQYIEKRAVAAGYPAEKMEVLYSGLDLSKFQLPPLERDPNLVLFVGRLVEKKGVSYLLQAIARVQKKHANIELAIIGDGPLRASLEAEAAQLGVPAKFLGKLMHPEPGNSVHDWMRRARLFCGPSVEASDGNTEGVPFVFVESHALGLPAVGFQHAGICEAVLHGETGLLAPERNVEVLAEYIERMLTDDPFWLSCSARAKKWVYERFDLSDLTKQLEALYQSVLDQNDRGSQA